MCLLQCIQWSVDVGFSRWKCWKVSTFSSQSQDVKTSCASTICRGSRRRFSRRNRSVTVCCFTELFPASFACCSQYSEVITRLVSYQPVYQAWMLISALGEAELDIRLMWKQPCYNLFVIWSKSFKQIGKLILICAESNLLNDILFFSSYSLCNSVLSVIILKLKWNEKWHVYSASAVAFVTQT